MTLRRFLAITEIVRRHRPTALFARLFAPVSLLTLVPLLAAPLVACGDDDDGAAPSAVPEGGALDGGGTDARTDDETGPIDNSVTITNVDRWGFATGTPTEVPRPAETLGTVAAIVSINGGVQSLQGVAQADGSIRINSVPNAPWILETRTAGSRPTDPLVVTQYPIDGARKVRLGVDFWARRDATTMTDATKLALGITTPAPFVDQDVFRWTGLRSFFTRSTTFATPPPTGHTNSPTPGGTTSADWTIDGTALDALYGPRASGLPTAGDDLRVTQERSVKVTGLAADRFDPWAYVTKTTAVASLDVTTPNFAKDVTNTVTGTMTAPATESITLAFTGSTFAEIRTDAGYPKDTRSSVSIEMHQEAGPSGPIFSSIAPVSWTLGASSTPKPVDATCFPNAFPIACDAAQCGTSCADATDGRTDPGDFTTTFDAPRLHATGLRDIYAVTYSFSLFVTDPTLGTLFLGASASQTRPKTNTQASFILELGAVKNLGIGAAPLAWDGTSTVSLAAKPVVHFDAPGTGIPDAYEIAVIELAPDGAGGRGSIDVAHLTTRETSLRIPDGILRDGRAYYVRVTARRGGIDSAQPNTTTSETTDRTGIFSPMFRVGL